MMDGVRPVGLFLNGKTKRSGFVACRLTITRFASTARPNVISRPSHVRLVWRSFSKLFLSVMYLACQHDQFAAGEADNGADLDAPSLKNDFCLLLAQFAAQKDVIFPKLGREIGLCVVRIESGAHYMFCGKDRLD